MDTNVKGLLFISRQIIPQMVERQSGQIVNIASIAGVEVYENGNVYCASKHAVAAITKSMRIDLVKYGIKVSGISPGAVETEFSLVRYDGDADKAKKVYEGIVPLTAADVADALEFVVTRPPHVNINDILIMPTQQASSAYMHRV
ncbi:MAG: SDR family NAD(P)-dependent oxidoreductase [Breznakibacter sp.]